MKSWVPSGATTTVTRPIEAHFGMPFWWYYLQRLRDFFIERFSRRLPGWTEMVKGARVLTRKELTT
jgi:hypothetical protein